MALPRPSLPMFPEVIPSTKQKVHFRQFTVKEEAQLLQAQATEDAETIASAINAILTDCIEEKNIKIEELALFDIEYLMAKLRGKSVGEYIDLELPCDIDEKHPKTLHRINLDTLCITIPETHKKIIDVYDGVQVELRYPRLSELNEFESADGFEAIAICIDKIITQDEVFNASDFTSEELVEWVEGLSNIMMNKIMEQFFETLPCMEYKIEYKCRECGKEHIKVLKGLSNFFV